MLLSSLVPTVYIQLSPERITLRNPKTGETLSEVPSIAVKAGADAINPFAHPRSLVSDFLAGETLLKALLRKLLPRSLFTASPRVVLHPLGDPDGGFTQIEVRALQEMARGAGASEVVVWQGRNLTDQELQDRQFPADGKQLS